MAMARPNAPDAPVINVDLPLTSKRDKGFFIASEIT
jgi:hypothetical protein